MDKGANFSPKGKYRYYLWRTWKPNFPKIMFIMLNPSTADSVKNDPTIVKCIAYAKSWGYGGIYICNIYPWISSDPKKLNRWKIPEVHMNINLKFIRTISSDICTGRIVAAWGHNEPFPKELEFLKDRLYCLELSKNGIPKHPLYLSPTLQLKKYDPR